MTRRIALSGHVYEGLLKRRESKVVLAMEMFERDVQKQLDDYLSGQDRRSSVPGGGAPLGQLPGSVPSVGRGGPGAARRWLLPIFRSRLACASCGEGQEALADLGEHDDWAPRELLPNSELYWKRTDNAIRGHAGMMRTMEGDDRLYSTQSLWDNSMGESCALALDRYPGFSVLHVNGGFHSAYWDGTVRQLKQRKPKANVKTVSIVPVTNPYSERLHGRARRRLRGADRSASDQSG